MAITSAQQTSIMKLSSALFNKAFSPEMVTGFVAFYESNNNSLSALADALIGSSVYANQYNGAATVQDFGTILMAKYGLSYNGTSAAETNMRAFIEYSFANAADSNSLRTIQAIDKVLTVNFIPTWTTTDPIWGDFVKTLDNKAAVAIVFKDNAANAGKELSLADVTADTSSATTFNLTEALDNLTGTVLDDIFNAVNEVVSDDELVPVDTLGSLDILNGGAGNDTLNIYVAAGNNVLQKGTIQNIETINIYNTSADAQGTFAAEDGIDASQFVGATLINQVGFATGVLNLTADQTARFTNVNSHLYAATAEGVTSINVSVVDSSSETFVDDIDNISQLQGFYSAPESLLVVEGEELSTVNITGSYATIAAGTEVDDSTLKNQTISAIALEVDSDSDSLTINSTDSAIYLVNGAEFLSIDASGVDKGFGINDAELVSLVTGDGRDIVEGVAFTSALATPTAAKVDAMLDLGAGDDYAYVGVFGEGKTTFNAGAGNDFLVIEIDGEDLFSSGTTDTDRLLNTVELSINGGTGDDNILLETAADLTALFSTYDENNNVVTSNMTVDGGAGFDTLWAYVNADMTNNAYTRLATQITNVEHLAVFIDEATVDASKLTQFEALTFQADGESAVVNAVVNIGATQDIRLLEFTGTLVGAGEINLTTSVDMLTPFSGGYNENDLYIEADVVNLDINAALVDMSYFYNYEEATAVPMASRVNIDAGEFRAINVNMQSVESEAGVEADDGDGISYFSLETDIEGLETITVTGKGVVDIDTISLDGEDATGALTINLSGMEAFIGHDEEGEEIGNISETNISIYAEQVETITLGGAIDNIYVNDAQAADIEEALAMMDVITGFNLDEDTIEFDDDVEFTALTITGDDSIEEALLDAQIDFSAENQGFVFVYANDTYIVWENEGSDPAPDAFGMIKLVGTYDTADLVEMLNLPIN